MLQRNISTALFLGLLFVATSCGGGDDDDDGNTGGADASTENQADGGDTTGDPDADTPTVSALGNSCTGMGQGDCPDGFVCLPLQGGSWCSKVCGTASPTPMPDNDICADGYEGPGLAACILQVRIQGGPVDDNLYCSVVCEDLPDGPEVCDETTCDGTCPGELSCEGPVLDQNRDPIATSCQ